MPKLRSFFKPSSYLRVASDYYWKVRGRLQPNQRGVGFSPPGHFYSPLLDIKALTASGTGLAFDGEGWWEHVNLRSAEQKAYFQELLANNGRLPFPTSKTEGRRYFSANFWFAASDAFTLSGVVQKEKPRRIIEVGSGFSSAVMLDTLDHTGLQMDCLFIDPFPERLESLLSANDRKRSRIEACAV